MADGDNDMAGSLHFTHAFTSSVPTSFTPVSPPQGPTNPRSPANPWARPLGVHRPALCWQAPPGPHPPAPASPASVPLPCRLAAGVVRLGPVVRPSFHTASAAKKDASAATVPEAPVPYTGPPLLPRPTVLSAAPWPVL